MVMYQYGCGACAAFDATYPMGEAPAQMTCAACGGPARRRFTPPLLARTPRALTGVLDAQEASRSEPRVVGQVPAARRRGHGLPADPRHARLPRP